MFVQVLYYVRPIYVLLLITNKKKDSFNYPFLALLVSRYKESQKILQTTKNKKCD